MTADQIEVVIGPPGRVIELRELKDLSTQLQTALTCLANELVEEEATGLTLEILDAHGGSLHLTVRVVVATTVITAHQLLGTFIGDLQGLPKEEYRPGMTGQLVGHYRNLLRSARPNAELSFLVGTDVAKVDATSRSAYEAGLKERISPKTTVVGQIENLNVHRKPYTFSLYTKLQPRERVECRFDEAMLPALAEMLKARHWVEVCGEGSFGPVGLYPQRIDVEETPRVLTFDPDRLRAFVGAFDLVGPGETVAEVLERNRESAGIG